MDPAREMLVTGCSDALQPGGNLKSAMMATILVAMLAGCAGPKVLSEQKAAVEGPPLLAKTDAVVAVVLDNVVVRNGESSWAQDAVWDEYRLRVHCAACSDARIVRLTLFDVMGNRVESSADRGRLADETVALVKRYEDSGYLAKSEEIAGWSLVATGATVTGLGLGTLAYGGSTSSFMAGAAATGVGLAVGSVVLVGAGVLKIVNDAQVDSQLASRSTPLPAAITTDASAVIVFFPVVLMPSALEVAYVEAGTERIMRLDTHERLSKLHVERTGQ